MVSESCNVSFSMMYGSKTQWNLISTVCLYNPPSPNPMRERERSLLSIILRFVLLQLNNPENWKRLKSCLVKSEDCNNLSKKYKVHV